MTIGRRLVFVVMLLLACVSACESSGDGDGAQEDGGGDPGAGSGAGPGPGPGGAPMLGPDCLASDVVAQIATATVDKVDLLFTVDNSYSMASEQAALANAFPAFLRMLTSGDYDGDGVAERTPASDVHLGVVSTDLGLVGVNGIPNCEGLGDNGVLNNLGDPNGMGCAEEYPQRFLSYGAANDDVDQVAADFACIARLGTNGCGFEQHLETTLKALWPAEDTSRVLFLPDTTGNGELGQGGLTGTNAGFLRGGPAEVPSLLAIVVVTDEEDCSSKATTHFVPNPPAGDPLALQGLNTRCYYNPTNLYALQERYFEGFRALRPGNEDLVIFAAIAGVPPQLVSDQARDEVDFDDQAARDAYYDRILAAPEMLEQIDDRGTPEPGDDSIVPSCDRGDLERAYPPRRLVELAKLFGRNGVVQSICQDDLGAAMQVIASAIGDALRPVCLPRALQRRDDGLVGCNVVWELPAPGAAPAGTPTSCSLDFLRQDEGNSRAGGRRCRVNQLAVSGDELEDEDANGWYYDDFSDAVVSQCGSTPQRILFTSAAKPPSGAIVTLECAQTQCVGVGGARCAEECSAGPESADASHVGDPCLPNLVPEAGFTESEVYLATNHEACGGGVCMAYHLRGDVSDRCVPSEEMVCASPDDIEARVYCTCRCDAPAGFAECDCPDGLSCVDVLEQGNDALKGGYCVRNGTLAF